MVMLIWCLYRDVSDTNNGLAQIISMASYSTSTDNTELQYLHHLLAYLNKFMYESFHANIRRKACHIAGFGVWGF